MKVLEVGQQFAGRYRVLRALASGGMGAVYVALQEATELQVALKVLWPHVLEAKDAVERFQLEARVAARIQSDNIVRVFDAGYDQASHMPFLVMELLQGQDLDELVRQRGPLPPELAVPWLRQVSSALDKAHSYRDSSGALVPIVHRDLKPENLFLTVRDNGEHVIKVLDFGIAKVLSRSTSVTRAALGTPVYMAYEQAAGEAISPQTDIWALGLIAYFLLTGGSYWRAAQGEGDIRALFAEILSLPITPASERAAQSGARLSPAFDAWFNRCVNRDPGQRFESAGAAVEALSHCLLGKGMDRRADESSASAATVIAGVATPYARALADDTMTPNSHTHHPGRSKRWPLVVAAVGVAALGLGVAVAWPTEESAKEAGPQGEALLGRSQAAKQAASESASTPNVKPGALLPVAPVATTAKPPAAATAAPVATVVPSSEPESRQVTAKIRRPARPTKPKVKSRPARVPPNAAPKATAAPEPRAEPIEATPKAPERDPLAGPRR